MPEGEAQYRFGWSGVTAARTTLKFSQPVPGISRLDVSASTIGSARVLWRLDATALLMSDLTASRPLRVRQLERYRGRTVVSALEFDPEKVFYTKARMRRASATAPSGLFSGAPADRDALHELTGGKAKRFKFPEILDLQSALLFVRSQPLKAGDVLKFMVFQDNSAYLAVVRVAKRETVKVPAGSYPAIKLDLSLNWVDDKLVLQPHKNFKRASGWISDDPNRLLLKVESEVFIGSVWGELVRFAPRASRGGVAGETPPVDPVGAVAERGQFPLP